MPTYVYECRSCEKIFEVEQRITADPLTDCECGAMGSLRRVIQPTAVMFKGDGFFINDSTKAAPKTETETPTTSESTPAPVEASKPETAPPKVEDLKPTS